METSAKTVYKAENIIMCSFSADLSVRSVV